MTYQVVFTCRNILRVFKETVEADSVEHAKQVVLSMVKDAGLTVQHITSIVQL